MSAIPSNPPVPAPSAPASPAAPATPPAAAPTGPTFTITVNGQPRTLTQEEMLNLANKGLAADEKFQEAAAMRKANEAANRQYELTQRTQDASLPIPQRLAAARELALAMGADPAPIDQALAAYHANPDAVPSLPASPSQPQPQGAGPHHTPTGATVPPRPLTVDQLPPEVREELAEARTYRMERERQKIFTSVEKAVDSDAVVGTLKDAGEAGMKAIQTLQTLAKNEVQRRVVALGQKFGPELVAEVLQDTCRPMAEMLGKSMPPQTEPDDGAGILTPEEAMLQGLPGNVLGDAALSAVGATPSVRPPAAVPAGTPASGNRGTPGVGGQATQPSILQESAWVDDFTRSVQARLRQMNAAARGKSALNR